MNINITRFFPVQRELGRKEEKSQKQKKEKATEKGKSGKRQKWKRNRKKKKKDGGRSITYPAHQTKCPRAGSGKSVTAFLSVPEHVACYFYFT